MSISINIGKMIKFKRKEKGLSGELLAKKSGLANNHSHVMNVVSMTLK